MTTETRFSTHSERPLLSNVRHGRFLTVARALLALSLAGLVVQETMQPEHVSVWLVDTAPIQGRR